MERFKVIIENDLAVVIRDGYPLTTGHSLIIPKRHLASLFEARDTEQRALLQALQQAKAQLDEQYHPAGYNIGINDGVMAGQTVMHLHIHLIPRYPGDCQDPRGGVRWILPEKAVYWE
jgi:diadenosine tetraphosphate (Ap4A) HIT family hydrolase